MPDLIEVVVFVAATIISLIIYAIEIWRDCGRTKDGYQPSR